MPIAIGGHFHGNGPLGVLSDTIYTGATGAWGCIITLLN